MEKQREEGIFGGVDRRKLEEALTAKQESDAKLTSVELKNRELAMELTDLKAKVCFQKNSSNIDFCHNFDCFLLCHQNPLVVIN